MAEILDLTVGGLLRETAAKDPDAVALIEGVPDADARRWWAYGTLLEEAEEAARALLGRFAPGERVAIWANNIPEWVVLELAAGLAGLTVVTVNPALRERELVHVLGQSRAAGVFLVPSYRGTEMAAMLERVRGELPALREVVSFADWECFLASGSAELPVVEPRSAALVLYTSGTTGAPKGAVLHHRGVV